MTDPIYDQCLVRATAHIEDARMALALNNVGEAAAHVAFALGKLHYFWSRLAMAPAAAPESQAPNSQPRKL